jgi:phage shock protein PspC (stress-responsive transcriptional regulator)
MGASPASGRLTRSRDDRWIAGICGGIAEHTGIDPTLIRVILVIATILGAGSLVVIYLICWVIIPKTPEIQNPGANDVRSPG